MGSCAGRIFVVWLRSVGACHVGVAGEGAAMSEYDEPDLHGDQHDGDDDSDDRVILTQSRGRSQPPVGDANGNLVFELLMSWLPDR
jgi:hypothetical protein